MVVTLPPVKERKPIKDLQKVFHYTDTQSRKPTRDNDPYEYQAGWGNRFQSEVIPGTLPAGQNNPQEVRFGLYTEGITYSAFAAPRHANFSTYMYRVRPAAAHSKSSYTVKNVCHADCCRWLQDGRRDKSTY
jgi:homogentisate 1,2-dioxygenase